MVTVLVAIGVVGAIVYGLWHAQRGQGSTVVGQGNAFEAYYGKDRYDPGKSPPCDDCVRYGCIGAGECRCQCHKPHRKKK
jgi:hypothetical protein